MSLKRLNPKPSNFRNIIFILIVAFSSQFSFAQCVSLGLVNFFNINVEPCQPVTGNFTITGDFTIASISPGGVLTVTATNSSGTYTQTFPAPYTVGTSYLVSIPGIPSDGSALTVTAFFSNSLPCGLTLLSTSPAACVCVADAGSFSQNVSGNTNSTAPFSYQLCFGDILNINTDGNFSLPQDFTASWVTLPVPFYNPGIELLLFSCPPTTVPPADLLLDPCLVGLATTTNGNFVIQNLTGNNQTLYYVPSTMYDMMGNLYAVSINGGDWCYDLGPTYQVTFLSPITSTTAQNCNAGTATATISGGMPSFDGSNFTVVAGSLLPATATFNNTTCANNGTITIAGLANGDNYSFDIVDDKNCPVTVSGTFVGANLSDFSYAQADYCQNNTDPLPILAATSSLGGIYSALPVGLSINAVTGLVDLSASMPGIYTISYFTAGSFCPTTSSVPFTVNSVPTVTLANQATCVNSTSTFTPNVSPIGTYDYTWAVPVGTTNPGNINSLTTGTGGSYSIQITDQVTNCASIVATATLILNPLPNVTLNNESFCLGTSATLLAVPDQIGTALYSWTVPVGGVPPGNTATFSTTISGIYSVQITDANGCISASVSATVSSEIEPMVSLNSPTVCAGANALLSANVFSIGTFSYSWTVPVGAINPGNVGALSTTLAGTYSIQITDLVTGCTSQSATGTVTVNPLPIVTVNNPIFCAGTSGMIMATSAIPGNYTYLWVVPAGVAAPGNVATFQTQVAGNFDVQITDLVTSCTSLVSSGLSAIIPLPTVVVNNPSTCANNMAQIQATVLPVGTYNYVWTIPIGATNPGNMENFMTGTAGNYTVIVTDLVTNCSSLPQSGNLTVNPIPLIDAGANLVGCETDFFTLTATGAGIGGTYLWTNNVVNGVPFSQLPGSVNYSVSGISAEGCAGTDIATILVDPTPVVSFNYLADGVCAPVNVVLSNTTVPQGTNCMWTFDDGVVISGCGTITRTFTNPGIYGVTLGLESMVAGCFSSNYQPGIIVVEQKPSASFFYSPDDLTTLYNQVNFTNTSIGASNYSWNFGDNSQISNAVSPTHVYTSEQSGSYDVVLYAFSPEGCLDSALITIEIKEELLFYVPNAFTPDGNEVNQIFQPIFTSGFDPQDYNLLIFDRWGQVVFESNDASLGWVGTFGASGKICQDGTYTWKITYRTTQTNERNVRSGHVTLLR